MVSSKNRTCSMSFQSPRPYGDRAKLEYILFLNVNSTTKYETHLKHTKMSCSISFSWACIHVSRKSTYKTRVFKLRQETVTHAYIKPKLRTNLNNKSKRTQYEDSHLRRSNTYVHTINHIVCIQCIYTKENTSTQT